MNLHQSNCQVCGKEFYSSETAMNHRIGIYCEEHFPEEKMLEVLEEQAMHLIRLQHQKDKEV